MAAEIPSRAQRNGLIEQAVSRILASVVSVVAASMTLLAVVIATSAVSARVAASFMVLLATVGLFIAAWTGRGTVVGPWSVLAVVALAGVVAVDEREVLTGALLGWVLVVCAVTVDAAATRARALAAPAPTWPGSVARLLLSTGVAGAGGLVVVLATGGAGHWAGGSSQVAFAWLAAGAVSATLLLGLAWWSLSRS